MEPYLEELIERALSPISEETPCGENARYDERYDNSKTEIMKLTAGGASIDWRAIRTNIDSLLSETTKDLTLAAYLSLALLKEYQYPGLLAGLKIIEGFMDTWWESMFPPVKRAKARIQIFEWMDERLSVMAHVIEPEADQADALRQCKAIVDDLPEKVQPLVKAPVTGFGQLRTELNQWLNQLPEPEPEPVVDEGAKETTGASPPTSESESVEEKRAAETPAEPKPPQAAEPPPQKAPTAPKQPAVKLDLPPPVEELETLDEGLKAIMKIVHLLRGAAPLSLIPYRLARILTWDLVQSAPPAAPDGKTNIPPPDYQVMSMLEVQRGAANWTALTQTAEHLFITSANYFLDLQRDVYQGLSNQGADEAAQVVAIETGRLLNRLPGLLDLTYSSGLPFANNDTRQWAADAMKAAAGPSSGDDEADDNAWLKEATKVAGKSMAAALPLLNDAISEAKNTKSVMQRKRDVAKFFIINKEFQWAMPLLESLYDKIESTTLAQWEPNYCSEVWELLLRGYEAHPDGLSHTGRDRSHMQEIRQKLFEINVAKAAGVTPKKQ
jgi:type VI secretion system protein VasJ